MNFIGQALAYGFTAEEIVKNLLTDKKIGKKVKDALRQGFSEDEIVSNLANESFASKSKRPQGFTSLENVNRNLAQQPSQFKQAAKDVGKAAALAAAGYALYAGAPAIGAVGNYLSNQIGGGAPPAPGGPPIPVPALPAPGGGSLPALASGSPGGPGGGGAPSFKQSFGSLAKQLVPSIAGIFGFKNKKLVSAIANIIQNTGSEVADVYKELEANYDISTPEKAAVAAESLFKKIQTGTESSEKEVKGKPIGELKKEFAKDLKSAVIRQTEYDPEAKKLRIVFNNDSSYEYDDVPEDVYSSLTEGGIAAKTSGENQYGKWWVGKDPSLGASFNKLIKQGGYNFTRGPKSPLSEEEREEYETVANAAKSAKGIDKTIDTAEKTTAAAGGTKFKGKPKKQLTSEQIRNRRLLLEKQLQTIKRGPKEERNEELVEAVNERLRSLNEVKRFSESKKHKLLSEESMRIEKREGKNLIKKMLILLPPSIVKVFKSKLETLSEEEMLKMIKDFLTKK